MRVKELTARIVRIPLKKPIRHASHTRTETENIVVHCVLSDRSIGHGEGVPREYVTGESAESALSLLKQTDLAGQLAQCSDFLEALAMIERLQLSPVPGDDRGCQGNAARCALELALLDAYGRALGEPLSEVTKHLAPDLYQFQPSVRYSGAITSAKGLKARFAAWKMRFYGFKQLKVKVGIEGYDDASRLLSIRRRVGKKIDLRVDANEAWKPGEVVERIRELAPANISSVEQPVAHADVSSLPGVRNQIHTPIMLDESLCSRIDGERAIQDGLCDLFNLRLSKCGGFIPSLRLAQLAKQHGLGYQLGCQIGESAILSAAGRHFACSVAGLRYLEGSYDRHLVREALGEENLTFGWGGRAPALPGIGLGFHVDPAALERVTLRVETLLG